MSLPELDVNNPRNSTHSRGIHVPADGGLMRWFAGDVYSIKLRR
jgi:hypothetical protein